MDIAPRFGDLPSELVRRVCDYMGPSSQSIARMQRVCKQWNASLRPADIESRGGFSSVAIELFAPRARQVQSSLYMLGTRTHSLVVTSRNSLGRDPDSIVDAVCELLVSKVATCVFLKSLIVTADVSHHRAVTRIIDNVLAHCTRVENIDIRGLNAMTLHGLGSMGVTVEPLRSLSLIASTAHIHRGFAHGFTWLGCAAHSFVNLEHLTLTILPEHWPILVDIAGSITGLRSLSLRVRPIRCLFDRDTAPIHTDATVRAFDAVMDRCTNLDSIELGWDLPIAHMLPSIARHGSRMRVFRLLGLGLPFLYRPTVLAGVWTCLHMPIEQQKQRIAEALGAMPNLRELALNENTITSTCIVDELVRVRRPQLEVLSIKDTEGPFAASRLAYAMPNLRRVELSNTSWVQDEDVLTFLRECPNITHMNVSRCTVTPPILLRALEPPPPRLVFFGMSFSTNCYGKPTWCGLRAQEQHKAIFGENSCVYTDTDCREL